MRITGAVFMMVTVAMLAGCARETERPEPASPKPAENTTRQVPEPIVEGLQTPESVLYDPEQDVYYISNINGAPLEADGNGFISRVSAGNMHVDLKWIDGGAEHVELDAPKGMGIVGDELWVTDITRVRRFARKSGAPRGEIPVPGSTFLNDIATAGDVAFVSDSGLTPEFGSSGTDSIHRISRDGSVEAVAQGDDLGHPNGLMADGETLWVVTFGSGELYRLTNGERADAVKLPAGSLDGLVRLDDGSLLISSWDASALFRGTAGGTFEPVLENLDAPADIGYDSKRNLVLVPHFNENRVSLHRLP